MFLLIIQGLIPSLNSYLVKVPLLLVKVGGQRISSLHINHEVLHLSLQPLLGLLQRGTLGVHSLDALLSILQALGKLFPVTKKNIFEFNNTNLILNANKFNEKVKRIHVLGLLQFLSALDSISLIFASPLSHLTVGLGHASLELRLGLLLLLKLLSEQIAVMAG